MSKTSISKWLTMLLLMMVAGISGMKAQTLTIGNVSIEPGGTTDVAISLNAEDPVYGLQTDLYLPELLTLVEATANGETLDLQKNRQEDNAIRFVLLGKEGVAIAPGDVITLTLKADDGMSSGDGMTVDLKNIRITTSIKGDEVTADDASGTVTVLENTLAAAKAALQAAIDKVKAYNLEGLTTVINDAQTAVDAEDATVESLQIAAGIFEAGVKAYIKDNLAIAISMIESLNAEALTNAINAAKATFANNDATSEDLAGALFGLLESARPYIIGILGQTVEVCKLLGVDTSAAEALLSQTDPEASTTELASALLTLTENAKLAAQGVVNTLKAYMTTFSSDAAVALAEDFANLETDINNGNIAAVKEDIVTLMADGKPYLQADIVKLEGYAQVIGDEAITADVAAMKNAVEAGSFAALLAAVKLFEADFLTVAPGFVAQIKDAVAAYKAAGKTNAIEQLEDAIAAAERALGAEDKTIVTVGLAVRNLIVALQTYQAANLEEDPELTAPTGWTNAITNGNLAGDDVSSFVSKVYPSDAVLPATIETGAGKNGGRGIVVKTADETGVDGATDWDSQFWIVLNDELPTDTKLHVEFDYKASQAATAYTQAHANPGEYHHFIAIGDVNFTTEWQHFSDNIVVNAAMAKGEDGDGNGTGMKSIAFNLAVNKNAVDYQFDNFGVWYQAPKEITEWANIVENSDMEGEDNSCFYVTEQGVGGPFLAKFTEGIGVDGSKAIKVQSADDVTEGDHEAQNWDTQFFVRLPYQIPAGTKYRVSFDYKADKAGDFDTQAHVEPGGYIHYECIGTGSFTTSWQTYSAEGTITEKMSTAEKVMQTIAFDLANNRVATEFIFDNVKFEIDADIVAELTKNPATNPTPYPEGIIPDGTYYVMSASDGTLINAEGALDAKGAPITFTFDKYSKGFTIEGADYFSGKQWTIANAFEGMSGYYTISTADGFLAANATALEQIADGTADAAVWIILEKAYWEDIVNSTYTVAGTKNLTGTENDWDIAETNQMVLNEETGLFEKKFRRIAIDAENQPEFKVVQTNMEGENIWYPENSRVITTDEVGGEGLYDITITFDPSDFKEVGIIAEKRIVFPENAIVYDFEAAADADENPANKNGSAGNGQAFYGWENPEKTDSKRQDYKGYEWAEGSLLPEVCHVWRRSDRINGNVANNGGLKCPSNKEMAVDGLNEGDKVIIVYNAENATDKEIIWAIGDGSAEGGPGHVRATATINGVEAVSGETTIASGAEILVNSVTPADNGTGYIVFQVKKGMIIKQIAVIPTNLKTYTATFTTNAGWEKAYAYAWSGEGESTVKFLGDMPGTEMTPGNGGNDWMISFRAEEAPEMILFNNGIDAQTEDFDFEDGKAYEYNFPVKPGTYYLYNVAAGGYVVGANTWGTQASISQLGGIEIEAMLNDGKYELKTEATYPGKHLGFDGYVDNGDSADWTIIPVEGQEGVFTLSTDGTKVLFWDGGEATSTSVGDMPANAENAYWKFVTKEEREALFADATPENPADATFLIINPDFSRNARTDVWAGANFGVGGGDHVNNNAEMWGGNTQTFNIKQQVTVPDGVYRVVWNGFYRYNNTTNNTNDVAATAHAAGEEHINSFVYLNETDYPLTSIADEDAVAAYGKMPFSQEQASEAFGQGLYEKSAEVNVIGGTLTIGIKKVEHPGCDWTVWDNFRLFYLTSVPAEAFKPAYEAALAAAEAALKNADYAAVTGEEKTALEQAIADNTTVEDDADAYKAAIQALETATNAFTSAKTAYEALIAAKDEMTNNQQGNYPYASAEKQAAANESLQVEATSAADANAKVQSIYTAFRRYAESSAMLECIEYARDFTSQIVNPNAEQDIAEPWNVVLGENSGGSLTIRGDQPWTDGDGNSTHRYFDGGNWGAQAWDVSMIQEVMLPKGKYQLTVRSRAADFLDVFSLFVGTQVNASRAKTDANGINELAATEMTHIGDTGGLFDRGWNDASVEFELSEKATIAIGVLGVVTNSQHQWMSFSNFRLYQFEGDALPTGISETTVNGEKATDAIYNLSGQKVQNARKGLYIINGKKVVK